MKKLLFTMLAVLISTLLFAQSERYVVAIKKNLMTMDSAFKSPAGILALANNFERIAAAEKNQWLPYYYAALCQINYGFRQEDKSGLDAIAEKAGMLINTADSLMPNNSELSCLKSMNATLQMLVNPMARYMQYAGAINDNMEKAMEQDASNPRPYVLKGQNLKNTPVQFGGGCETALPILKTALEKFASFKSAGELYPNWGKEITEQAVKDCQ